MLLVGGAARQLQRNWATVCTTDFHAPTLKLELQDFAIGLVVIHQQCAKAHHAAGVQRRGCVMCFGQCQVDDESGPFAQHTFDPDGAAHEAQQTRANGQAQTGAAVLARCAAIGLRKVVEVFFLRMRRNAQTGVLNTNAQAQVSIGFSKQGDADHDLAGSGELNGIADEIGNDLAQPERVAVQCQWRVRRHKLRGQFQPFGFGGLQEHAQRFFHHIDQAEVHGFQFQLARLNFGEVQDVVDDPQQVAPRRLHGFSPHALLRLQFAVDEQLIHAQYAVHGGANFMAHGGQKFAFGLARSFGGLVGLGHALLGCALLCDIDHRAHQTKYAAVSTCQCDFVHQGVNHAVVGALVVHLIAACTGHFNQCAVFGLMAFGGLRTQKLARRLAQHVGGIQANQLAACAVQAHVVARCVFHHHRNRQRFKQRIDQSQAFSERLQTEQTLGAVARHAFIAFESAVAVKARAAVHLDPALLSAGGVAAEAHTVEVLTLIHAAVEGLPPAEWRVKPINTLVVTRRERTVALHHAQKLGIGKFVELMLGIGLPKPVARHFRARLPAQCGHALLGDVDVRARQPFGAAVSAVDKDAPACWHPHPMPVSMAQARFVLIGTSFPLQVLFQASSRLGSVVWMAKRRPGVYGRLEVFQRAPQ